jgi:hypothetical protein
MNSPILIYVNVSIMGCVNEVLKELIDNIKESGIIEYCHSINFIVNGDKDILVIEDIPKSNIIYTGRDTSVCEFMTLDKIWKDSKDVVDNNNDLTILYLHTKGVSRTSDNIKDWTRLLTYFNVTKWQDRIEDLDPYDCTGINLSGSLDDLYSHPSDWGYTKTPVCYAGNFWWSKASHIAKLNNPIEWAPDKNFLRWRMMCEMWVCSYPTGKYNNAYHSIVDHYYNPYPKELYEAKNNNKKMKKSMDEKISLKDIALKYTTDKANGHNYMDNYEFHFERLRYKKTKILEIGIGGYTNPNEGGGSLKMWKEYFENGNIYGFDIDDKLGLDDERIKVFKGSQVDNIFLDSLLNELPDLNIVIDDGSHYPAHVIHTFNFIFPRLKSGTIYVVEDTQTSYWRSMGGDYNNHSNLNTTMNYFKFLADGLNFREFADPGYQPTYFDLNITSIHFYHNLIFIYKGDNSEGSNVLVNNMPNNWAY